MPRTLVAIVRFNETRRLSGDDIAALAAAHGGGVSPLVNDGGGA